MTGGRPTGRRYGRPKPSQTRGEGRGGNEKKGRVIITAEERKRRTERHRLQREADVARSGACHDHHLDEPCVVECPAACELDVCSCGHALHRLRCDQCRCLRS